MKVLFLDHETALGGAELMLLKFLRSCDRERFQCELVVPQDGPLVDAAQEAGIPVHRIHLGEDLLSVRRKTPTFGVRRGWSLGKGVRRLRHFLVHQRPNVVVSNTIKAHVYGSLALWRAGIPFGWRLHDIIDGRDFSSLQRMLLYTLARNVPASIAGVSDAVCLPLREAGIKTGRIIYNGVGDPTPVSVRALEEFRNRAGLSGEHFVVTLPGRIMRAKGHSVFLKAAHRVVKTIPHARFVITGSPFKGADYLDEIQNLVHDLNLKGVVHFEGFSLDMAPVYAASHVIVVPSLTPESLPTVILETMAAGRVTVASDIGGAREMIRHRQNGFLVPPGDEDALAQVLIDLARDASLCGRVSATGRRTAVARFSMNQYVTGFEEWLTHLESWRSS